MNKISSWLLALVLLTTIMPAMGKEKETPFYDSKSWIVNVAGDAEFLSASGFGSKIDPLEVPALKNFPVSLAALREGTPVERQLNEMKIGKAMIDALTANGTSDAELKKRALENMQRQDIEFGTASLDGQYRAVEDIVSDDYLPILQNNFIVLFRQERTTDKKGKEYCDKGYAIFKVEIDKEMAFSILSTLGNPEAYNSLDFPVKFCYSGMFLDLDQGKISKNVPELAVRGVLLRRHPARISIGENAGLNKGDLVSIYSQRVDENGTPYSKRISRARVCAVWENEAQINFEANTAGNRKNGDVVVKTPDSHLRFGLAAMYTPHTWGGKMILDSKTGFTRAGIIHHFLMDLGFTMTDKPGEKFIIKGESKEYKAPMFLNVGLGYGLGKTFLGFMDVMPFFMIDYEASAMFSSNVLSSDIYSGNTDDEKGLFFCSAIRIPIGFRFSFNLGYPTKIFLEGGYALNFRMGYGRNVIKETCDLMGAKRQGLFVNLGFMF